MARVSRNSASPGRAQAARHLVHDPHRRADEVGLGALRQTAMRAIVERQVLQRAEPAQQADHSAALDDTPPPTGTVDAIHASKPSTSMPWPRSVGHALDVVEPALPGCSSPRL